MGSVRERNISIRRIKSRIASHALVVRMDSLVASAVGSAFKETATVRAGPARDTDSSFALVSSRFAIQHISRIGAVSVLLASVVFGC
jgi:hypothetical protein